MRYATEKSPEKKFLIGRADILKYNIMVVLYTHKTLEFSQIFKHSVSLNIMPDFLSFHLPNQ